MRKLVYTAVFLQLSISSLLLADPNVTFNDSNLETAVANALLVTAPITESQMLNLHSLSATGLGISDLTGLEYAFDVNELRLNDNLLSDPNDLLPISGLEKLIYLNLNNNQITDLPEFFLVNATDVNELHLSYNLLSGPNVLSHISGLTSLVKLYLDNNQITDISAVSNLVNLDTLFLSVNDVNDISPVSGLTGLTSLSLAKNQIIDISSLSGLSNLTILDLTGDPNIISNQIVDISSVSNLTSLEHFFISDNNVVDISGVPNLTSLERLYLDDNEIIVIPDMSSLTSLQYLYLNGNEIEDITGLIGEEPNDLETLDLRDNLLNLTSYCTYLQMIVDNNPLTSVLADDFPLDDEGVPTTCLAHDICPDAIEIEKSVLPELDNTYLGTTSGSTGIEVSKCGEGADELWDYKDIWHSYTPLSDEAVDISLCGSSFDTTLAVYDSCSGTRLACNDQWCGSQSLVTMGLTEGVEYLIRVAGYDETTGDYELIITDAPAPPANNTCQDAIAVVPYTAVTGSTITAYGPDITSCTLSDTRSVWYKFIPTISGLYMMDPDGSDYNATLAVFTDCAGTELTCNDLYCNYDEHGRCIDDYESRIVVNLVQDETYYIRISGFAGKGGGYSLTVTLAADINKNGVVDIIDLLLLIDEWMMIDDEGDFTYGVSYADIAFAEGEESDDGSGGDKFINVRDFAAVSGQWGANP